MVVGVHGRTRLGALNHERLERGLIGSSDHGGRNQAGLPVLRSSHHRLAHGAASLPELLRAVLVLLTPAHERLVYFDWAGEGRVALIPRLTDAVRQMSRRLLRDVQITV